MKHDSPHPLGESPSFGGMTTGIETTQVEVRDNAYWPDEALLADFVEQDARAEKDDWVEQVEQPIEDSPEYAILYFVS